jgi:hypothetical protein
MIEVKNPYHQIRNGEQYYLDGFQVFEEGTQAGIKALIEWLFKPCTEHPIGDYQHDVLSAHTDLEFIDSQIDDYEHWHYAHQKDCPECMQELEKEVQ